VKAFVGPVWEHCQCVAYSPMFVGAPSALVLNELSSCSNLELLGNSWELLRHAVTAGPVVPKQMVWLLTSREQQTYIL
jgi:hypothetical protein